MKNVKDILRSKTNSDLRTTTPDTTVIAAIGLMAEKNVGSLLVMENDKLVGIITERDYARKVILAGKSSSNTLVKEIMTQKVLVIQPSTTIEECMALMIENSVRYLPVIEEGKVIGVISIGNVINTIISEQKFVIKNLEQYIMRG
jgi:CBS domain-containing protein